MLSEAYEDVAAELGTDHGTAAWLRDLATDTYERLGRSSPLGAAGDA